MDNTLIYAFVGFTFISNLGLIFTIIKSVIEHSNKVQKIETTQEFTRSAIIKLEKDLNQVFQRIKK